MADTSPRIAAEGAATDREPGTANREPAEGGVVRWVDGRGVRWVTEADRLPRLRRVAEALGDPALRPVRDIPSRAHFRLPPPDAATPGTFVKHYRLLGWPRRLRHVVRPLPAAVEWSVARALAPHGVAAVVPWAWGLRRRHGVPAECFLVADDLGDLVTLEEWIPSHRQARHAFRGALADLARTLRRLHALHYFHGDPHQRNIIPHQGPEGLRWTFLDFQQARRAWLSAPYRRLRDLGRVFHGVRLDLGRTERARLLRAYLGPGHSLPRRLFRLLEAVTLYYEFRLLRRRARRCLTITDHFRRSRVGSFTLWHVAEADVARIAMCLRDGGGGQDADLAIRPLRGRGRRAWLGAHALLARGLPTPRPLAWVAADGRGRQYLVTHALEGAVPFLSAIAAAGAAAGVASLMRAAGIALRRLHASGAWHGATPDALLAVRGSLTNVPEWQVLFARPEYVRFRPWVGERHRRHDVVRLAEGLCRETSGIAEDGWRAFFSAYLLPAAPAPRREAFRRLIARSMMPSASSTSSGR